MNSSRKVIFNTLFLYANMIVTMVVQLIAVRLIFHSMGMVDYGIYNIVAGIVALSSFMNVAMAASTQRYLSFYLGNGDEKALKEIFYQSLLLHCAIGIIVVLILEIGGLYYVDNLLQAPADRLHSASLLLHCITISTFVNVITVPYEGDINANEDMGAIALINILDSLMKLGTAIYLYFTPFDPLIIFGLLTMSTTIITLIIKRVYCLIKYRESRVSIHRVKDFKQMKSMASFAMWNLIGTGCGVARYQGTALILNRFFGIIINAAYGIAMQVNGLLLFFANTIVRAMRPQIVKSEGANDHERMLRLSTTTCRITSLMVAVLAIPLFVEMDFVLRLWLGKSPGEDCLMFCRCFLVIVFLNQLTIGLQIAMESMDRIRPLQLIVGSMHIMALPLGWLCFEFGMPPYAIMMCVIAEELIALIARTILANRIAGLQITGFMREVVAPCIAVTAVVCCLANHVATFVSVNEWLRLIMVGFCSTVLLAVASYAFILSKREKSVILDFYKIFHR